MDETIDKVVELSDACEAKLNANDISIPQRLSSKKPGERPVFVRLARRAGELQILRNNRAISNKKGYENVKVFGDLTALRVRFFNILKTDFFSKGMPRHNFLCVERGKCNLFYTRTLRNSLSPTIHFECNDVEFVPRRFLAITCFPTELN